MPIMCDSRSYDFTEDVACKIGRKESYRRFSRQSTVYDGINLNGFQVHRLSLLREVLKHKRRTANLCRRYQDLIIFRQIVFEYIFLISYVLFPELRTLVPSKNSVRLLLNFVPPQKKFSIDDRHESALRPARPPIALLAHFRFSSARERNTAYFISHGVEH